MKKYLDRVVIEIHIALDYQLCECQFFFFIPGDTVPCNVTYPGRPGPPGFDGPPGMIQEKLLSYTFPTKRTGKTDKPIANPQELFRIFLP